MSNHIDSCPNRPVQQSSGAECGSMRFKLSQPCFYETSNGLAYQGDSAELMREFPDHSVNVICTSPPFPLLRQKKYGNVSAEDYLQWFLPFAKEFKRILHPEGSLVIDLGGTWLKGLPYRSLYHYEFLLKLCKPEGEGGLGFFLAQELYWYNPAKLPTPAEWVTVRRIRVKDAVNTVWWLRPSAIIDEKDERVSNRRVLKPYSKAQKHLMKNGYKAKTRPSEHNISDKFGKDNKGAIPPNLILDCSVEGEIGSPVSVEMVDGGEVSVNVIAASNTASNDRYLRKCRADGIKPHPARFPADLPRFIIGLCSEERDLIFDPFAGSNMTGAVAQEMNRRWLAVEMNGEYLKGSIYRFPELDSEGLFPSVCDNELDSTITRQMSTSRDSDRSKKIEEPQLFPTTERLSGILLKDTGFGQLMQSSVTLGKAVRCANFQPMVDAIESLSAEISGAVEPFHAAFKTLSAWGASLSVRMKAIEDQWVIPDLPAISVMGFARMARLSDAVRDAKPYSDTVSSLVAGELGRGYEDGAIHSVVQRDKAAIEAGLMPELIAFPPETYPEVVAAAGFEIRVTPTPLPRVDESKDGGIGYHPEYRILFNELEQQLRRFVGIAMLDHIGPQWIKRGVPNDIRQRWQDRKERELGAGRAVYDLIQYSDFMDLLAIICMRGNWQGVFKAVFRNKEEVMVSFRRLVPVRNAIAHSRPLGRADLLTLHSEATRFFSAINEGSDNCE